MALPEPEPGLVISYAYLWHHEYEGGREEGRKDRPCVIVLATASASDGATVVTVVPVTHRPPDDAAAAVEIPQTVKQLLGLNMERSWVVVSEGNKFVWPGYDLRKVPGDAARYEYGFLPPRFFSDILKAFGTWHKTSKGRLTGR
jgi:PemK-like, MazF-like toxin of type II toxin-antitoxin system